MTVRCFKSVSPSVKQKDIPEAISTEAFITCAYSYHCRRITFFGYLWAFFLSSLRVHAAKWALWGSLQSLVLLSQTHQVWISGRFRVGGTWPSGVLRAQDFLKPGTTEKWLSTYLSLGCSKFSRDNSKPVGMLCYPLFPFIFLGGTWSFYRCDCVIFQYIKSSILWHPRGTWLLLGCNTHCARLCCQAVS